MADTAANTNPGESTQNTAPPAVESQAAAGQTTPPASGEKTYTNAEVEAMIQQRLARVKAPATPPVAEALPPQDTALQEQLAAMQQTLVQTEIKAQMAMNGVQTEKVERACRLVDLKVCVGKSGQPDVEKIKAEIETLMKDFPELKATTTEGAAGFKIGADGTKQDKGQESTDNISRIFGNKK